MWSKAKATKVLCINELEERNRTHTYYIASLWVLTQVLSFCLSQFDFFSIGFSRLERCWVVKSTPVLSKDLSSAPTAIIGRLTLPLTQAPEDPTPSLFLPSYCMQTYTHARTHRQTQSEHMKTYTSEKKNLKKWVCWLFIYFFFCKLNTG